MARSLVHRMVMRLLRSRKAAKDRKRPLKVLVSNKILQKNRVNSLLMVKEVPVR